MLASFIKHQQSTKVRGNLIPPQQLDLNPIIIKSSSQLFIHMHTYNLNNDRREDLRGNVQRRERRAWPAAAWEGEEGAGWWVITLLGPSGLGRRPAVFWFEKRNCISTIYHMLTSHLMICIVFQNYRTPGHKNLLQQRWLSLYLKEQEVKTSRLLSGSES